MAACIRNFSEGIWMFLDLVFFHVFKGILSVFNLDFLRTWAFQISQIKVHPGDNMKNLKGEIIMLLHGRKVGDERLDFTVLTWTHPPTLSI